MTLFRRKPAQRPMISWPVDRPSVNTQSAFSPYPTLYSPIASSPSADFSFAQRWPLKDDAIDTPVTSTAPLQINEDVSIILGVYPPPPPPPPPKDDILESRVDPNHFEEHPLVELPAIAREEEHAVPNPQQHSEDVATESCPSPSSTYHDLVATTSTYTPPLPTYQEEADIYRYLSRSPPLYKDDEDVYEDVYDNISPLRSTRSFANEAIRPRRYSSEDTEPVLPLRVSQRNPEADLLKQISPLHSHPAWNEELLEEGPFMEAGEDDEYDDLSPLPHALYSSYNSSPLSWRSNRTSDLTMSTIATSYSHQRPSDDFHSTLSLRTRSNKSCTDYQCDFDYEDYFEKIQHEIDISDARPDDGVLAQAGKIPIFDSDGKGRPFSSIYSGDTAIGEQQMVIFVRHFFCGACQAYLRALSKAIPFATYFSLPKPTSITIIGLGSPELINSYRKRTNCPFPIYSDPTKRLYKALGMKWVLRPGKNPQYMKGISSKAWVMSQVEEMNSIDERLKYRGGHMLWVGGEFLFRQSEVVWCHRMKTYRGHSEVDVIKKVLEIDERT
ncbi:uncharacterized protein PV09_00147 [Verruconis gallopava]|uniref:Thioredoxin domain-containing protein n=1 Tax=Verruconis gallopava TaxID=253628 RepID=A0A0D2ARR4_9PEZI|nr:uncharacterized protein PV09_00147 [Verruconis gallopava]KIW09220.1 hypothetical protein PV09_00147 [Verruconis gallopava]